MQHSTQDLPQKQLRLRWSHLQLSSSPSNRRSHISEGTFRSSESSLYYSLSSLNIPASRACSSIKSDSSMSRSQSEPNLDNLNKDHTQLTKTDSLQIQTSTPEVMKTARALKNQLEHIFFKNNFVPESSQSGRVSSLMEAVVAAGKLVTMLEDVQRESPSILGKLNDRSIFNHAHSFSAPAPQTQSMATSSSSFSSASAASQSLTPQISLHSTTTRLHERRKEKNLNRCGIFLWHLKVKKLKALMFEQGSIIKSDEFHDNFGRRMQAVLSPNGLLDDAGKNVTFHVYCLNKKLKTKLHPNTEIVVNVLDPLADSQIQAVKPVRCVLDRSGGRLVQEFIAHSQIDNFKSSYITISLAMVQLVTAL